MKTIDIFALVDKYHYYVRLSIERLQQAYACDDLIACLKTGAVPRQGQINGVEFRFHGLGCYMMIDGYLVNWDFGPNGRTDGFEAWKLWQFTKEHRDEFGEFADLAYIQAELAGLRESDSILTMKDLGYTGNLLFFKQQR